MTKEILEILQSDIYTDAPEYAARIATLKQFVATITFASEEEITRARRDYKYGSNVNMDFDAECRSSIADDGIWVQAWVWLDKEARQCSKLWFVAGGRVERSCGENAEFVCAECGEARCTDHNDLSFVEVDGRVLCEECNQ